MRRYIRHPSSIPIEFALGCGAAGKEYLKNVGHGGLCFRAHLKVKPGSEIHMLIPAGQDSFEADGVVAWCRSAGKGFEVGVRFLREASTFALRMVEQVCYIEQYRRDILQLEGRELTGEEAANEWIERFAARFP